MNTKQQVSDREAKELTRRLVRCMPATQFEMQTIIRLAGIVATRRVPTASVEAKRRPRMMINPDFVQDNCTRDEHLFLLVMHELWHVLLAHTRMYPMSTRAHNIAFDAIINSALMGKFSTPEYMGFFDKLYKADEFPYCLLRPPVGWPANPVYPDVGPKGTKELIERLYPKNNFRPFFSQAPLYEEVLQLLVDSGMDFDAMPILLLGSEGDIPRNPDGSPINDPFMKDALKQVAKKWPNIMIDGQSLGSSMRGWDVVVQDYDNARRTFSNVLKQTLGKKAGRNYKRGKTRISDNGGNGVMPNSRDRMLPARRALHNQSLLYAQNMDVNVRLPENPARAHMYLDVSGSMSRMLPALLGLIIPYAVRREVSIYQFSTAVAPLTVDDLRKGHLTTTGGTQINCVFEHILEYEDDLDKVILLTDGAVGAPKHNLVAQIEDMGLRMYAVLPHRRQMNRNTAHLMYKTYELPPAG